MRPVERKRNGCGAARLRRQSEISAAKPRCAAGFSCGLCATRFCAGPGCPAMVFWQCLQPSGRRAIRPPAKDIGVWLSLVEHLVRDEGVAGSNPATPTSFRGLRFRCPERYPENFASCLFWRAAKPASTLVIIDEVAA